MRILEIGPDGHPSTYQAIVRDSSIAWETLDIYPSEELTYLAKDEYTFPIPDGTFDIVFSAQVIEHVRKVWLWTKEVARVCKQGGYVITINPVSWPYHEAPIDCWRIYPDGMRTLYEEAGIRVQLAKHESLSSSGWIYPVYLLKEAIKPIMLRGSPMWGPVIDTISIGVKG